MMSLVLKRKITPCLKGTGHRHQSRHVCKVKPIKQADGVVLGAGVIGLNAALKLLQKGASVLLVERGKELCTGATGAGQGYLWMAHRSPNSAGWDLAMASMALWKQTNPEFSSRIGLQATGSLLLASNETETCCLQDRASALAKQGIPVNLLDAGEVCKREPALALPPEGSGMLTESDLQLDGRKTAAALLAACMGYGSQFQVLMGETVIGIHADQQPVKTETDAHILVGRLGTIVAAGVWSGELLSAVTGHSEYRRLLRPRKGHLLEIDYPPSIPPLHSGVMEMSYTKHYAESISSSSQQHSNSSHPSPPSTETESAADITFTATTSASGSLLLGSSREFVSSATKECAQACPAVVGAILEHAKNFLPGLQGQACHESVRVGLRPFAVGGYPMIGPVPGHEGLFVAAGHEGSGLALSPVTAHLLAAYILEEPADIPQEAQREVLPATRLLMADL